MIGRTLWGTRSVSCAPRADGGWWAGPQRSHARDDTMTDRTTDCIPDLCRSTLHLPSSPPAQLFCRIPHTPACQNSYSVCESIKQA